jgi:lycopene cyclase domain-containing protein
MPEKPDFKETPTGPTYNRGKKYPASALLFLPFLIVFQFIYKLSKDEVDWRAAAATVAFFEIMFLFLESYHLRRGHWVYNEARIFGPKVFGIPIEEPLLYYLFSPLVIISAFHIIKRRLSKKAT